MPYSNNVVAISFNTNEPYITTAVAVPIMYMILITTIRELPNGSSFLVLTVKNQAHRQHVNSNLYIAM